MKWREIQDERFTKLYHGTDKNSFGEDTAVRIAITDGGKCECCNNEYWWVSIVASNKSCGIYEDDEVFTDRYDAGVQFLIKQLGRSRRIDVQVDSSEHGFEIRQDVLRKRGFKSLRFDRHVYDGRQVEEILYELRPVEA